jgi:hypothetical protein
MRATLVALLLLLASAPARATPNFPGAIAQDLGAPTPQCSICHAGGVTGRGTVTTLFGQAMLARGLVANDTASLQTALDKMRADKVDSNGNGILDVDELIAGSDPNATSDHPTTPTYGCSISPGRSLPVALLLPAALLLCCLLLRLTSRSAPPPTSR